MSRKLNSLLVALATVLLLSLAGSATAQTEAKPGRTDPIKRPNNKVEAAQDKGWDGKVQGKQIVTPVEFTFESAEDYDNFAAGKFRLNLILRNTLSGQIIRLDSNLLREGFRPSSDKSNLTAYVVIDNASAPLGNAACVETKLGADRVADGSGVDVTLSYAACGGGAAQGNGSTAAQRPGEPISGIIVKGGKNEGSQMVAGNPIHGIIVKGGKNPGGNMRIAAGGSETSDNAEQQLKLKMNPSNPKNAIIISSSKGSGSPKQAGF